MFTKVFDLGNDASHALRNPSLIAEQVLELLKKQWNSNPEHIVIEVLMVAIFVYFWAVPFHKAKKRPIIDPPTKMERQQIIRDFESKNFKTGTPASTFTDKAMTDMQVVGRSGHYIDLAPSTTAPATRCIDYCTFDFHSLSVHKDVSEVAKTAIRVYGVGSAGPRGFYGTIKPHFDFENNVSAFLGAENTALFSYSFATISTVIPTVASRGDEILVDEAVGIPIHQGVTLSRANAKYYRHNDMLQLEELMVSINAREKASGKVGVTRKFVATEGVFRNLGDLCYLQQIVRLCKKYHFRIILDDCMGFGVVGPTGRGTPEHFGVSIKDISLYVGSLGGALGAIGGFCCGDRALIDHQRLAATGYVYSASLPPYVSCAASAALELIDKDPFIPQKAQKVAIAFRKEIRKHKLPKSIEMIECIDDVSPLVHFRPIHAHLQTNANLCCDTLLDQVVQDLFDRQFAVRRCIYNFEERSHVIPSLRVALKSSISEADTVAFAKVLVSVLKARMPEM
eukprot:GILI01013438.1.p1 GENE.GILI01013438.1~~GILI01013438.1.p1  ORF type:complete len:510 (+),score=117.29 GILI01013438.1:38-1567(+)